MAVYLLSDDLTFPYPQFASEEGLLAIGGDLSQERLQLAYRMGIFPWYSENEPIMWWSPDPRLVLYPAELKISKSLAKIIKKRPFNVTMDQAFESVIKACAQSRTRMQEGTWIVNDMITAYCRLHESGLAHSVETWQDGKLAGGLYGVSLGRCFLTIRPLRTQPSYWWWLSIMCYSAQNGVCGPELLVNILEPRIPLGLMCT